VREGGLERVLKEESLGKSMRVELAVHCTEDETGTGPVSAIQKEKGFEGGELGEGCSSRQSGQAWGRVEA